MLVELIGPSQDARLPLKMQSFLSFLKRESYDAQIISMDRVIGESGRLAPSQPVTLR